MFDSKEVNANVMVRFRERDGSFVFNDGFILYGNMGWSVKRREEEGEEEDVWCC